MPRLRARRLPALTRGLAVALIVGAAAGLGAQEGTPTLWLDSIRGVDAIDRGSPEAPLRSIGFALDRLLEQDAEVLELRLQVGEYRGQDAYRLDATDPLPWSLPREGDRLVRAGSVLRIVGVAEAGVRPTIVSEDPAVDLFRFELGSAPGRIASIEFESLELRGGRSVCVASIPSSEPPGLAAGTRLALRDCSVLDTSGPALVLIGGARTASAVSVETCEFVRTAGALFAEVAIGGSLDVDVEDSRVESVKDSGFDGLDAAFDIHCEDLTAVGLELERCRFEDAGVVALLSSPDSAAHATVRTRIANSLVLDGDPGSGRAALLVVAATAIESWTTELVHNTVHGTLDDLVRFELAGELDPARLPVGGVRLVNNLIATDPGASRLTNLALELSPFFELRSNLVPAAWIARGTLPPDPRTLGVEPGLVDPASGDFSLSADSPAVDQGERVEEISPGEFDLEGRCRVARSRTEFAADLGAFERPGDCVEGAPFLRGDCDRRGSIELSDAIRVFSFLFLDGRALPCADACDSNDDGRIDLTDGVVTLNFLFLGLRPPMPPFPDPGFDPSPDSLGRCE